MRFNKNDIDSAKSFCEARLTLEISQLKNDIKFRHFKETGLSKFSGIDSALAQLRAVRKLYTLYEGLYLLEEKLGYGKKDLQNRDSILSSFIKSS